MSAVVLNFRSLRRLLVALVIAASAGLARAQAPSEAPVTTSPDAIIRPAAAPRAESPALNAPSGSFGALTFIGALALATGGIWLAKRGRLTGTANRDLRHLSVEETRALGNRQYLVVAAYDDKRFLIGVCPGRIEFLTALDSPAKRRDSSAS